MTMTLPNPPVAPRLQPAHVSDKRHEVICYNENLVGREMSTEGPSIRKDVNPINERVLLLVLAAVQFTIVLDFLIMMPLGPQYMRVFAITSGQFGLIVSAYAVSAGLFGIAAGFGLDRFDRKQALLWLSFGFTIGTFLCASAPSYPLLVAARVVTGAFGGVEGALILAIIGDVIPDERRGAAMGIVMSSYSVASICGVPIGLALASQLSWHVPFFILGGLCSVILVAEARVLPPLRGHLHHARGQHPAARVLSVMMHADHQKAFLFMAALTSSSFVIFPYLSAYMVADVGLTEKQLPFIYLAGGSCTIFSMNLIGQWADRAGKLRVFTLMTLSTVLPILTLTNLPRVPLYAALATSTVFMICMSGRFVPAMALMTSSIESRYRGGFMSINSSVQQFSSGLAAYLSGQIIGQAPGGVMTHFPAIGLLSVGCGFTSIYLARFLKLSDDQRLSDGSPLETPPASPTV
ncbi:MAG TPA: MFS transporter [Nitrospiria bacterium]|nr:MFS transporter [Nitrospiria bacterium]